MTVTERRKQLIYTLFTKHQFKIVNISIDKAGVWITNLEVSRFINNNYFTIELLANAKLSSYIDEMFISLSSSSKNEAWQSFLIQKNIKESDIKNFIIDLVSMVAWNQSLFKTHFDYTIIDSSVSLKNKEYINNRGLIIIYRN